jgi:hypothetical protein
MPTIDRPALPMRLGDGPRYFAKCLHGQDVRQGIQKSLE